MTWSLVVVVALVLPALWLRLRAASQPDALDRLWAPLCPPKTGARIDPTGRSLARATLEIVAASTAELAFTRPWIAWALLMHALYLPVGPWFAGNFLHGAAQPGGVGLFYLWGLQQADGARVYTLDTWAVATMDWCTVHAPVILYLALRHGRATRPAGPLWGAFAVAWFAAPALATARPVWRSLPWVLSAYVWHGCGSRWTPSAWANCTASSRSCSARPRRGGRSPCSSSSSSRRARAQCNIVAQLYKNASV